MYSIRCHKNSQVSEIKNKPDAQNSYWILTEGRRWSRCLTEIGRQLKASYLTQARVNDPINSHTNHAYLHAW